MWATDPKLIGQPSVGLEPFTSSQGPSIVFGHENGFTDTSNPRGWFYGFRRAAYYQAVTTPQRFGALHALFSSLLVNDIISIRLAANHLFRIELRERTGTNGDYVVLGGGGFPVTYLIASLYISGQKVQSATINSAVDASVLWAGCGYVIENNAATFYGFVFPYQFDSTPGKLSHRNGAQAPHWSPTFGCGTACLTCPVDIVDVEKQLHTEVEAAMSNSIKNVTTLNMSRVAAHLGPFYSKDILRPEPDSDKSQRAGQFVGSLNSHALRFVRPHNFITGAFTFFNHYDIGGDSNVRDLDLPDVARAGQPHSDTAFIAPPVAWRSNLFADHSANERLARVKVTWLAGTKLNLPGPERFYDVPPGEVICDNTQDTGDSWGRGNNEYCGSDATPFQIRTHPDGTYHTPIASFSRRTAYVAISAIEELSSATDTDLSTITFSRRGFIVVTAFYRRENGPSNISTHGFAQSLTQQQLDTLAAGGSLTLEGGSNAEFGSGVLRVTVQGIGPA